MEHDVVGAAETKDLLGVELQRITRWRREGKLPPPVSLLDCTPLWYREHILQYKEGVRDFPPTPAVSPYLGTSEAAKMVGVDKSQLGRWRTKPPRHGPPLPPPVKEVKAGPVWLRKDIKKFAADRRRLVTPRKKPGREAVRYYPVENGDTAHEPEAPPSETVTSQETQHE